MEEDLVEGEALLVRLDFGPDAGTGEVEHRGLRVLLHAAHKGVREFAHTLWVRPHTELLIGMVEMKE